MRYPFQFGRTKQHRLVLFGLPTVLAALGLAMLLALTPAPESGFNVPVAEAARPSVRLLGLKYHDFGFGSPVTVNLDNDTGKAHLRPGPDSNHGPIVLNDGDTLFVEVDSGEDKIGNSTRLAITGKNLIMIHTSCSKPLEVGFLYGPDNDETADNPSEFGGAGFQSGFEVIELVLSSTEPSDCVAATPTPPHTPTPTPTPTPTDTPTDTPTPTPTSTPPLGRIIICKDTNPETTGISFDFDTDIPGMRDIDLEDDDCEKEGGLDPREYEVIENLIAGWLLDDIDCSGTRSGNIDVDLASETVTIDLKPGEEVECTFTNVPTDPPLGRIIICKDTNPETTGISFDFDTDIPGMRDPDLEDDDCEKQGGLDPREYEIIENLIAGWLLDDIDCFGTRSGNIDVDLASETVTIDLKPGEEVECTFTNVPIETPTATPTDTPTDTPTHTPTETPNDTPTNTPTSTPTMPDEPCKGFEMGDANGPKAKPGDERTVNSIDSAFVLQFDARLINSLNCPKNADVNQDGRINSRDAVIILQFVARFIFHLPV